MCTEAIAVPIPPWATWNLSRYLLHPDHPEYTTKDGVPCFQIDACIAPALLAVWAAGFKTLGCCCGHGSGTGVISLDTGFDEANASR